MIFLTSDVPKEVDAAEATTDSTDSELAELEGEDRSDSKEDPHNRHCITRDPEYS